MRQQFSEDGSEARAPWDAGRARQCSKALGFLRDKVGGSVQSLWLRWLNVSYPCVWDLWVGLVEYWGDWYLNWTSYTSPIAANTDINDKYKRDTNLRYIPWYHPEDQPRPQAEKEDVSKLSI